MSRIYVTGASGALGGALLRHFGAAARALERHRPLPSHLPRWQPFILPRSRWLRQPDSILIHAAGLSSATAEDSAEDLAAPHLAFADALLTQGWTGHFLFLSSAAVYGEAQILPIAESHPTQPLNAYGGHKLLIEQGLAERARNTGFRLTVLRLANIYGSPLDLTRRRVGALILDAIARGAPFTTYGDGTSQRDYLHVEDFCRAVASAVARPPTDRVLNLGSGRGTSLTDLIAAAERLTGRRLDLRRAESRAEAGSSVLDIARARHALAWAPQIGLAEGLARLQQALAA